MRHRRLVRPALLALGLAGSLCLPVVLAAAGAPPRAADGRVIVLGFDGADARTIAAMMEKGELPHLKALAERGTFAPLATVNPAESPTAWASLNTGQNPAKTGVPGFVKRDFLGEKRVPSAGLGHIEGPTQVPIERFASTPLPTWSPVAMALAGGALALVAFFVLFAAVLRVRAAVSAALAVVLGGVGAWGGYAVRGWLPASMPVWETTLEAKPFWETAAEHGVACVVLDAAEAFDRPLVDGAKVLFGLGYPDARGAIMGYTIYTTDELYFARPPESAETDTGSGGNKFKVDERKGVIESLVYGPPNWYAIDRLERRIAELEAELADPNLGYKKSVELNAELQRLKGGGDEEGELARLQAAAVTQPLRVEKKGGKAVVTLGHETQELAEGQWSDWYHLEFELNPLLRVHAVTRAKLVSLDQPYFELYVDALHADPAKPPFWQPLSQPEGFAAELAHACGSYETLGWACLTHPMKDAVLDPVTFMQDIEFTATWREKLTFDRLAQDDWRVLLSCLSTPDRVQHMMYQYYDPEHPLYDATAAARTFTYHGETITLADAIPATYRHLDRTVGRVVDEFLKPGDTLIVCGDHGFQTFRREVNLNNWLHEQGYLALGPMSSERSASRITSGYVDWSKTRAYALGLGGLYVNLKGREGSGIVDPADKDALLAEIAAKFLAATDPANDRRFGKGAYSVSESYDGPHLDRLPDMFLCFDAGWRISWNGTGGGLTVVKDDAGELVPGPACSDNTKNWSGDHVSVDPSQVACVFFSNRKAKLPPQGVSLMQIAPTVLALVGVEAPSEYDLPAIELE